jgi:hypothetical protein
MTTINSVLERALWSFLVLTLFALCACDFGGNAGKAEQAATAPKTVVAPVGFSATAHGFKVNLTWSASPDSAKIVGFEIKRNGRRLIDTSAKATSTIDEDVRPGKQYRYAIRSKGEADSSEWVVDEVKIEVPPLKEARLEGDFSLTGRIVSQYGYDSYPTPNLAWSFHPKCRAGACDVVWKDVPSPSIHGLLEGMNAHYRGTYRGYFFHTYNGTHSISDANISLRVVKAQAIAGEWRATKVQGTLESHEAPQFGCIASGSKVAIKGSARYAGFN